MAFPFHPCKEILHKCESWSQVDFNNFETSFYIRSFYWSILYYTDTDEIPGFFLLIKVVSSLRAVKILFLSFTFEDIGVVMVTNMIGQLQESFLLRHAAGSFEISFTKWLQDAKTVQLPVTLNELKNSHIKIFQACRTFRKICRGLRKWCWKIHCRGRKCKH